MTLYAFFVKYIIGEKKMTLRDAVQLWKGIPDDVKKTLKDKYLNKSLPPSELFSEVATPATAAQDVELRLEAPLILSREQWPQQQRKKGRKLPLPALCKVA